MRLSHRLLLTLLLGHTAQVLNAGSYPPGTALQTFDKPDGTTDLADGTTISSEQAAGTTPLVAGVYGSFLRLAERNTTNAIGAFKLPDLDPGSVARTLDLKFNVLMDGVAGSSKGEGWSINFGRIPDDEGTGEGGFAPLPGGLTIAFDTLGDAEDPSSIEILVGGVRVADFTREFTFGTAARAVSIHWDSAGLDLGFDNKVVCTDLPLPGFAPGVGHRFAFSARTTAQTMDVAIDAVKATSTALPVIETGGVVISEFMADNPDFEDEFAGKPSWIELLNGSSSVVDLTGWYLTDTPVNLKKWRIEGITLTPYNYQVVFASGRDRQLATNRFAHANFSLANNGGYVALVRPDGQTVASQYTYGPQDRGVSFGEQGTDRKRGYMYPSSPGTVNTQTPAPASFAPKVTFSHPGGIVIDPLNLTLSVPAVAGIEIRYTTNRTDPGPTSFLYTDPLPLQQQTTIRARAYAPGYLPGPIESATYLFIDGTLTNYNNSGQVFESNIPLVVMDSFAFGVDGSTGGNQPFRPAYAVVIPVDPSTGRARLTSPVDYRGPAGTHVRGESSSGFDQRSYALELWDEAQRDRDASLLGMPSDSDWVLYGPWSEKTLMRNKLVFDWMLSLRGEDGMAMRTRFVELFFNQSRLTSGKIGYTSYRGVYVLMEKLKRGDRRVPLANLNDKTVDPELITGGYIIRKDKDDSRKNNWTTARTQIPLQSFDPDRMNTAEFNYVRDYINRYETALSGGSFRSQTLGYRAYIDPDTFIDAQWMLEVAKQVDGYVFSTYWHKDRGGRLRAGPLWDFNISLGNADYATGDTPTGWLYDNANGAGQLWYPRLHADPDYKLDHWDRYWEMRRSILATSRVLATIDGHMATLLDGYTEGVSNRAPANVQNPVARHLRKWPRLGLRDWPNPAAETKIKTWQQEVTYMKDWLTKRLDWLDDQSLRSGRVVYRPPVLSQEGGILAEPIQLTLRTFTATNSASDYPTGDLYYTLDNSDPRLPTGAISPTAIKYTGPLNIDRSVTLKARLYTTTKQWSPSVAASYVLQAVPASAANLVVSEILYRPAAPTAAELTAGIIEASQFEFLELRNIGSRTLDLAGVKFTSGVEFGFDFAGVGSRLLPPAQPVLLVADRRAFQLRYPNVPASRIAGQFRGRLNNGGDTLRLVAADGTAIRDFRFDDDSPWPDIDPVTGPSLVLKSPASNPNHGDPFSWVPSAKSGGTPATSGTGSDVFLGQPGVDTDGDGVTDLFEFSAGTDPENPADSSRLQPAIVVLEVNGVSGRYLTFEFQRRLAAQGVRRVLEAGSDLRQWQPAEGALTLVSTRDNNDGTVTDRYRTTASLSETTEAARYFRLRVELE